MTRETRAVPRASIVETRVDAVSRDERRARKLALLQAAEPQLSTALGSGGAAAGSAAYIALHRAAEAPTVDEWSVSWLR